MRSCALFFSLLACALLSSNCTQIGPPGGGPDRVLNWRPSPVPPPQPGSLSTSTLVRKINLKPDMVAKGTYGRRVVRPMNPRYITIHSTQNFSADASKHALALKRGALRAPKRKGFNRIGFLIWHFTVDSRVAIQHMPCNEQGEHADFNGPGNNYSIGIEMCENRGGNRSATIERAAMLTAYLMKRYNIPLRNVVPHYHWPRHGCSPEHKNCPWFLMDNGRPGAKWRWFQSKVNYYYRSLQ
ncbi:N-acetylmuramoyl-L-alanine amidase [Luteolibacter ambystomatis]|uniref:N-acetylmuramoyl-L-alanine amidase n=1 Tax=Luteolibacter ambystomatis TaxID=2824561 RepID=A0A975PGP7_9BACT|nr:N-acetylmuramoyl-L-alanine amidase [Luteolibacter ambystomatis]QUE52943.1 N-acetylmuramoyl-L-alanine amidase [Luteolibacter ambystomatis]